MESINNRYTRDMKQTAVEWFFNEFQKQIEFEPNSELDLWIKNLMPKAKEKEKEQIENAYRKGFNESSWGRHSDSENYYNETFKSE